MNKYRKQLESGGIRALLEKLDICERQEDYRSCAEIKKAIDEYNYYSNQPYPTRLEKEQIYLLK